MIVNWKKENAGTLIVPCVENKIIIKFLTILPGCNDIPDKFWNLAKTQGQIKYKTEKGLIEEIKVKVEKETEKEIEVEKTIKGKKEIITEIKKTKELIDATELKDIPAKKARDIVQDTWNLETLQQWMQKEHRDEIRAVIHNQIDTVNSEGHSEGKI